MNIIEYLDMHSGSLTFIATAVYVIATILICWANISATKASKAQLKETQKQFYSLNRPNIAVTIEYINRAFWIMRFTNCGTQTAYNVSIELDESFIESITEQNFKNLLKQNNGRICAIGLNQHYDLFIGSNAYRNIPNKLPVKGVVRYNGANSSIYVENFEIDTNNYAIFFSAESNEEKELKNAKEQVTELRRIATNLDKIASNIEEKADCSD